MAALVADNGSGTCNTEVAGDDAPRVELPSIDRPKMPGIVRVQVFVANAWICAPQATDRDLENFNVNAWKICASQATDRDLESFNVNAWICACQTTDRDLETKK